MKQITEIGIEARQKLTLQGVNNEKIVLALSYMPTQSGWFYDIEYEDFSLKGCRLVSSPNFLRRYRNILPFGISCIVAEGAEPYFIDDFVEERAIIYLLDSNEVEAVEGEFYDS